MQVDAPPQESGAPTRAPRDETDVLTVGFVGGPQTEAIGVGPDFGLGHRSDRKEAPRQACLIEHVHHVTLILGEIVTPA